MSINRSLTDSPFFFPQSPLTCWKVLLSNLRLHYNPAAAWKAGFASEHFMWKQRTPRRQKEASTHEKLLCSTIVLYSLEVIMNVAYNN